MRGVGSLALGTGTLNPLPSRSALIQHVVNFDFRLTWDCLCKIIV